jgi:hypothetical protein
LRFSIAAAGFLCAAAKALVHMLACAGATVCLFCLCGWHYQICWRHYAARSAAAAFGWMRLSRAWVGFSALARVSCRNGAAQTCYLPTRRAARLFLRLLPLIVTLFMRLWSAPATAARV